MQFLKSFFLKPADVASNAPSPDLPPELAEFRDRICVVASQAEGGTVGRADRLYSCEDARLIASELDREWPSIKHWAAPATVDEIEAHPTQAARLLRASFPAPGYAALNTR
jgi:hypothetical protein